MIQLFYFVYSFLQDNLQLQKCDPISIVNSSKLATIKGQRCRARYWPIQSNTFRLMHHPTAWDSMCTCCKTNKGESTWICARMAR